MGTRTIVKYTWPVMTTSLLLFCLGVLAAWWVDRTQAANSRLISREVHGVVAAQDLYTKMREFRRNLDLFLRLHNQQEFDKIREERDETHELLNQAKQAARTPREKEMIDVVERGYYRFYTEYRRIRDAPPNSEQQARVSNLVDQILTREVLAPARQFVDYNRQVIETSEKALRESANWIRVGFLLLGVCGALAGMALGMAVAVNLRRTMIKLHVTVQGVAGRLTEIVGPVSVVDGTTMQELHTSLQAVEHHIADIVTRVQNQDREILRREQLASLGQMAAGMAHELRNPLMPIKILVQSAMQRPGGGLEGRSLQVVADEIQRLEKAIQAFLDFARPPQLEHSTFDLRELCAGTLRLVAPRATQQEITLQCAWPGAPVWINADADQIRQVILNLLLNALDASSQGGNIDLIIRTCASAVPPAIDVCDEEFAALRLLPIDDVFPSAFGPEAESTGATLGRTEVGWSVVTIQDTGTGFPPELAPRLFDPFVTTKETGHGLGLSTCLRALTAHGGAITAHNRKSGGARFTFTLKLSLPPEHSRPQQTATAGTVTASDPTSRFAASATR